MFTFLAVLAFFSLLLAAWQWVAALRFPLHRRITDKSFAPPVTILKPLKGLDDNTLDCLNSWLAQDFPADTEILFGVASSHDPVCKLVNLLIHNNPGKNAHLVLCSENLGVNAKVSTLIQLHRRARHNIIVVSDADVLVPPDFLANLVAPLRDAHVGLVNCFYRLANPSTPAMRWEAVAINADFWSQVLQGQTIAPLDFALGAVMATRREDLAKAGGFEALVDYLADDFLLGNRIARQAGKGIVVCPVVVDCMDPPLNWGQVWAHQLRWARTIRVSKPVPYAASILSNATLWPLLWAMVAPQPLPLATLVVCIAFRIVSAHALQSRLGHVPRQNLFWWLPPFKDLLQLPIWAAAFYGNHIFWRGDRYRLRRDGKLVPG